MKRILITLIILCFIVMSFSGCISIDLKLPVPDSVTFDSTQETTAVPQTVGQPQSEGDTSQPLTEGETETKIPAQEQTTQQQNTLAPTTAAQTEKSPESLSADEILAAMATAINDMKNYQGSFTAVQDKSISLNITDCSLPGMTSVVNGVVQKLAGESKTFTFNFVNGAGTDSDGNSTTATAEIPPRTKLFSLTSAGIVSSKAEKISGNTVYTVVLVAETADYDHMTPTHHGAGMGFLNLAGMDISPAKITKADMQYPGGTIVVTVDANGRIISLRDYLPMAGSGTGALGILSADATFNGYLDETWTFTW